MGFDTLSKGKLKEIFVGPTGEDNPGKIDGDLDIDAYLGKRNGSKEDF
jgi:hypothetical protein